MILFDRNPTVATKLFGQDAAYIQRMIINIPTILTLLRIGLIPVLIVIFYLPVAWSHVASALVFGLAAITDWLDGYLARRLGQSSPFGAFLDPVADKLMVAVALVLLVEAESTPLLAIAAVVIIGREITVSALREWMAEIGERARVSVSRIGKFKTTFQMIALVLLLFHHPIFQFPTRLAGYILLYLAVILTLWSMLIYLRAAWPILQSNADSS